MTNVGRKAQKEGEANRGWNGGLSVLAKLKMGIKEILYYGGKSTCPESKEEFHDRIEDWLLNEVKGLLEYEPDSFEREKAPGEPDRVLIVDDDKRMVKRIASWLKPEGYQLFFAYNGTEALDKIAKEDIDLVVLDLEMPETNGDEVIQVMNSIDVLAKIPIIIFSSTTGMTTYKDLISSKGKTYNEPKGSEESYSLFGDKSKPLFNKVKSELKERCRLGHGYKKHPITIIRKKNGQWMNGFLEAYVPVVEEDVRQSLNCCYCEEKKISAYTAEFSFSDYHICRDCAHELRAKYPGFANKILTV